MAEEGSRAEAASGRRWVVDPLDGTINFLYGFPAWAVSVALEDAEGALVGVVHSPIHGETFCAVRGEGAFLGDGRGLRVRRLRPLAQSLVATGFSYEPDRRAVQAEVIAKLLPRARDIRRAGAAALDLAWLAAGRVDAFFERGLQHWDWAAGRLLVEEAGGSCAGSTTAGPACWPRRTTGCSPSCGRSWRDLSALAKRCRARMCRARASSSRRRAGRAIGLSRRRRSVATAPWARRPRRQTPRGRTRPAGGKGSLAKRAPGSAASPASPTRGRDTSPSNVSLTGLVMSTTPAGQLVGVRSTAALASG